MFYVDPHPNGASPILLSFLDAVPIIIHIINRNLIENNKNNMNPSDYKSWLSNH